MEHLYNRFRFLHIMDIVLPGCFLSAVIYIVLPSTIKALMPDNPFLFIIFYLVCGGFFGVLNQCLSFRLVEIYDGQSLDTMFTFISKIFKKIGDFFIKNFTIEEDEEDNSNNIFKDDIDDQEAEEEEIKPEKKKTNKFKKIIHKLGKQLKSIELFNDDEKIELVREKNEELLADLKVNVLSDKLKDSSDEEIYNAICQYLQGTSVKKRLADFLMIKGIHRNLSCTSILCAFLFLFVKMPGIFVVKILLKLIMFVLFIIIGDVFYHEYIILIDRVNRCMLIWLIKIVQK